jgi:hypothetical protein
LPEDGRKAIPVWLAGLTAFVTGTTWFGLIVQNFVPHPVQPFWLAIVAESRGPLLPSNCSCCGHHARHGTRFIATRPAFGATLACMTFPYLTITSWPKTEVVGKVIL